MKWIRAESTTYPLEVDTESSPNLVYLRRNIEEVEREDIDGELRTVYEYEEATLVPVQYAFTVEEKARADIDYIALVSDIDLED